MALWDLRGKALGVPCTTCWAGAPASACPPTSTCSATSARAVTMRASWSSEAGPPARRPGTRRSPCSTSPGRSPDARLMRGLREALGDEIEFLIDVHTRLDPAEAVLFCRELEPAPPSSSRTRCGRSARVVQGAPRAGPAYRWRPGSSCDKWEFRPLSRTTHRPRPDRPGTPASPRAARSPRCARPTTSGSPRTIDRPLCTAASRTSTGLPNVGLQEQARPYGWDDEGIIVAGPRVAGGAVVPADLPGLGVEIDLAAARRATTVIMNPPPRFRRDDGSFTNW